MDRKILVIGTGALGTVFGGLLQKSGCNVSYMGKGDHFEVIKKNGIKINGIWGEHFISPIKAFNSPDQIEDIYDIVLLCVKSKDTKETADIAGKFLKNDGICVSLQNGLNNVEQISLAVGPERTVGGRVIFGVVINTPGIATVSVYADQVLLGAPFGKVSEHNLIGLQLSLIEAGIPTDLTDNILGFIWSKVLYNSALNPLSAILNVTYGELGENTYTVRIMKDIIREIYSIAGAKNIEMLIPDSEDYIQFFFDKLLPPTKNHHSSMLQDIRAGRITEIDSLNNAIVSFGKELTIPTHVNETIVGIIKVIEQKNNCV